jgi:hypothetical protein
VALGSWESEERGLPHSPGAHRRERDPLPPPTSPFLSLNTTLWFQSFSFLSLTSQLLNLLLLLLRHL